MKGGGEEGWLEDAPRRVSTYPIFATHFESQLVMADEW